MRKAQSVAFWIDRINRRVGDLVSYLVLPLMGIAMLEVTLRYVFNRPTIWAWDVNIQLLAAIVVLAGGYTLLTGRFVVVDILVSRLSTKRRAWLDVITSVVVFFVLIMLLYFGAKAAWASWLIKEHTSSNWRPPIYPLKIAFFVGIILLFLQSISVFIRNLFTVAGQPRRKSLL